MVGGRSGDDVTGTGLDAGAPLDVVCFRAGVEPWDGGSGALGGLTGGGGAVGGGGGDDGCCLLDVGADAGEVDGAPWANLSLMCASSLVSPVSRISLSW